MPLCPDWGEPARKPSPVGFSVRPHPVSQRDEPQLRLHAGLWAVRTNLVGRTSPQSLIRAHHPMPAGYPGSTAWRNPSMNRKTLVLPAVAGLLAPVLAACGGPRRGQQQRDAIVVGTTDRFTATKDAPAPLDPAYAYDVGTWNILRQTVQTLMIQPRGDGEPVPEAAESCGFTRQRQRALRLQAAQGPEVLQRRRGHRGRREVLHRPCPRPSRPTAVCSPCCPRSTPSRPRATTRSSSTSRPRTPRSRSSCRPRSPASSTPTTTRRTSCATASTSTAPARTHSRPRSRTTRSSRPPSPRTPITRGS